MASTPPRSKLSCKQTKNKFVFKKESDTLDSPPLVASTPSRENQQMDQENDYSPVYFPSTQESNEDIDVLWDWHSPQSSHRRRKKQKRLVPTQSPKLPIKRNPSNSQNQKFEKLREELEALKEELALPDDESCLCLSPQQEMEFKELADNLTPKKEPQSGEFDDMFNDSVDEQLLLFSQQIENDLEKNKDKEIAEDEHDSFVNICNTSEINNLIDKYTKKSPEKSKNVTTNDSLYPALKSFHNRDTTKLHVRINQNYTPLQRTVSETRFNGDKSNTIQTVSGTLEFHRTKSFEMETIHHTLPKSVLEEIERKRLEAKARLEAKKKQEKSNCANNTIISPTKCSPEEIEKKRLQALAKREAKRLQEIVEKNRQEALRRLQISKMKKANTVKSTLTKKL